MAKNKKKNKASKKNNFQAFHQIEPKALSKTRADVKIWKQAETMAELPEDPKMFMLYNLYKDIQKDTLLSSQINNRQLKTLGSDFSFKKENGEIDEETTSLLKNSTWFTKIIRNILDTTYFGYTLIELDYNDEDKLTVALIPRQNVLPKKKQILKDYSDDKGANYGEATEYGTWLLDFGEIDDLGLLNKTIPHVLFKRFAGSCWSELCEIYGIPPRVMKTDTQNPKALGRAESMMKDWGAAAWFIIDEDEKIEWANGMNTSGDVYRNLIAFCNSELSLAISGAIIGQDTKNGNRSKEESSIGVLQDLVNADKVMVEGYVNEKVLPALARIGILPEGLYFEYDQVEDLGELWSRTKDLLSYKNIPNDWINDRFGIPVEDKKEETKINEKLHLGFFD